MTFPIGPFPETFPQPIFTPRVREIQNITQGYPCVVTTTTAHGYPSNQWVRLVVPPGSGMVQANNLQAVITVLTDTTFSMRINTTGFDPFVYPPQSKTPAQAIPFGETANTFQGRFRNILPPLVGSE